MNVYVLETDEGLTCIDGGWAIAASRDTFERSLKEIGYGPQDITSFLVTHAHRDHYSQAAAIRAEFGRAVVWLGADDRATLEAVRQGRGPEAFGDRLRRSGAPHLAREWAVTLRDDHDPDPQNWSSPDRWLKTDSSIQVGSRMLRAVHTPGHTAGHFVFADLSARLLFAGDHVLPTITPSVGFEVGRAGRTEEEWLPLSDFLRSLERVRAMPDMQLLPAHGDTSRRTHERIDELTTHHRSRLDDCTAAVQSGNATAWEVANRLTWTRRNHRLAELDTFNSGLAVLETQLHLELLASQGVLMCDAIDGVTHFREPEGHGHDASADR